ncbi:MAG: hypothetical protein IKT46_04170 [Clostridia bacterium]|nr:hypothetical protein [Clostridia bacterium]
MCKKKKNTKHEINRVCQSCERAQILNNTDIVLCSLNGVVSCGHVCRKFVYDPLKRDPKPASQIPGLDPDTLVL